jgi:hypothetical protein
MNYIAIKRSAQSVLYKTSLPPDEAARIGELLAERLTQPGIFEQAAARYHTTDAFEVGEQAAKEYIHVVLKR